MPGDAGARQRTGAGVGPLLTPALGAAPLTAAPEDGDGTGRRPDGGGCGPRTVAARVAPRSPGSTGLGYDVHAPRTVGAPADVTADASPYRPRSLTPRLAPAR
ncbi:hypothetical protein [Streptomyces sp. NPDC006997]|uniref:hypothetical protein n=1 Tax=Streptomyces sp. NPDC006997 TaxID=3155356 RepID=UPI0033E4F417